MNMNIKFNHTIDVSLTEAQKDCLAIQLLQEMYISAVEDIDIATNNPDSYFSHPDDIALANKRAKAAKRLLGYYMVSSDLEAFLDSVEHGFEYTFNPEPYMD
jgi:hypothetical protein